MSTLIKWLKSLFDNRPRHYEIDNRELAIALKKKEATK